MKELRVIFWAMVSVNRLSDFDVIVGQMFANQIIVIVLSVIGSRGQIGTESQAAVADVD